MITLEVGRVFRTADGRKAALKSSYVVDGIVVFSGTVEGSLGRVEWADGGTSRGHGGRLDIVALWRDDFEPLPQISREPSPLWRNATAADFPAIETPPLDQQKQEAAWKFDAGKARLDLIAPEMLFGVAEILDFGAQKYGERNWEKGFSWGRPFGALMRHMWAWWGGALPSKESFLFGDLDMETGKSHLWHAGACLMFLIAFEARKSGTDDRPSLSA